MAALVHLNEPFVASVHLNLSPNTESFRCAAMVFQILAYLLPAGAVVLGAIFASEFIRLRRQAACVAWPTIPGEIIAARVASMIDDDLTEVERQRGRRAREIELSAATLRYVYHVGGREYQSTRSSLRI